MGNLAQVGDSTDCRKLMIGPTRLDADRTFPRFQNSENVEVYPAMHTQMFGDRVPPIAVSVVEKFFCRTLGGQREDRSGISTDLKNFLPHFFILRKLSDVVDAQHVSRRRPDFFQGFHFGMSRSFARLSINLLSFFTDGPANPE